MKIKRNILIITVSLFLMLALQNKVWADRDQVCNTCNTSYDLLDEFTGLNDIKIEELQYLLDNDLIPQEVLDKGLDFLEEDITREDFSKIIMRVYGFFQSDISLVGEDYVFQDTIDDDVLKAAKIGLVKGKTKDVFDPKGTITREEIAVIFDRLLGLLDIQDKYDNIEFADKEDISDWAKDSISLLYNKGIIKGVGHNKYNPKGKTSGKHALIMIKRCYQLVKDSHYYELFGEIKE